MKWYPALKSFFSVQQSPWGFWRFTRETILYGLVTLRFVGFTKKTAGSIFCSCSSSHFSTGCTVCVGQRQWERRLNCCCSARITWDRTSKWTKGKWMSESSTAAANSWGRETKEHAQSKEAKKALLSYVTAIPCNYTNGHSSLDFKGIKVQAAKEYIWAQEGLEKLHEKEPNKLSFSSTVIRMIKSRRMRWVEHVGRMERK
jgi:hypothetical protein